MKEGNGGKRKTSNSNQCVIFRFRSPTVSYIRDTVEVPTTLKLIMASIWNLMYTHCALKVYL